MGKRSALVLLVHFGCDSLIPPLLSLRNVLSLFDIVVPVERIELPTFGLQNRLSVNRISAERVPKAEFVDSIIGYFESRN